jgi:hypothetical protein
MNISICEYDYNHNNVIINSTDNYIIKKEYETEINSELTSEEATSAITEQSSVNIFYDISNEMLYNILEFECEYEIFLKTFIMNRFKNSLITTSGNCKITYN